MNDRIAAMISAYLGRIWKWLRRHARPLGALAAIAAIVSGILSFCTPDNGIPTNEVCVSFETYSDDTGFGANIELNEIIFQSHDPEGRLFVNQSGSIKVLQFMDEGLTIDFSDYARKTKIKLAEFHQPIRLDVLGKNDSILETRTIDRENSTELLRVKQNSFSISKIKLSGGGNEGGVESVCAEIER